MPRKTKVVRTENGLYDAGCECNYRTRGWPRRKTADARIEQHVAEHEDGTPMQPIHEFIEEQGLTAVMANGPLTSNPFADMEGEEE